jgi:hypothetical protein
MTPATSDQSDLYLVFSRPSDEVSEEEFIAWYDTHIPEILETPGFESAQRFRVTPIVHEADEAPPFRYLLLWETTKDINELRAVLNERARSGEFTLPPWFSKTQYLTWSCVPIGHRIRRDDAT